VADRFAPGVELTCLNTDCDCSLVISVPCPLGDAYKCGCGHDLVPASEVPEKSGVIGSERARTGS
jgi:hypothetical protein